MDSGKISSDAIIGFIQNLLEILKELTEARQEIEYGERFRDELYDEINTLIDLVENNFEYSSVPRVCNFNKCDWEKDGRDCQLLEKLSSDQGFEIKYYPHPVHEKVPLYHHEVWKKVYPDLKLP